MKKRIWIAVAAALMAAGLILFLLVRENSSQTVGICYRDNESSDNADFRKNLEQALTRQGFELVVTDADGDQNKQLTLITRLAEKKCDILLLEPVMTEATEELKSAIESAAVPVVLCNRQLDITLWEKIPNVCYVGWDYRHAGTLQGQMVQQLPADINGDGVVSYLMLTGPENHRRSQLQMKMTEEVLASAQWESQCLSVVYGDFSEDSGRILCKQELAKYGKDIEVILCGNDLMAIGAVQAVADGGRTVGKDVYLLGVDGHADARKLIAQGNITGTAARDTNSEIENIVAAIQKLLDGQPVEKSILVPFIPITAEPVSQ